MYLEAQACGRVLLASRIAAAREVVRDGETGALFPPGDVHELADMTLRLAADPVRCATIGKRARAAARAHAVDVIVAKYEECLADLVARRDHASGALS